MGAAGFIICLAFVACGEDSNPRLASPSRASRLSVDSSALSEGNGQGLEIPLRYRCKEDWIWFPLEWSVVPEGTKEILLAITVTKIARREGAISSSLVTQWILGGLIPSTRSLRVGPLPSGAFITGHYKSAPNCPPRAKTSAITFTVYAMPTAHELQSFEAIGLATVEALNASSLASGSLLTLYTNNGSVME